MTGWWLENVLVETKIMTNPDGGGTTIAESATIRIEDGRFAEVRLGESVPRDESQTVDGGGMLLVPSMEDTHVHLDKTFYGGPWRAPTTARSWPERLREEETLLPEMSREIPTRSNAILDLLVSNGTTRVVAHCNVDHVVGSQNVVRVLEVLRGRDDIDWDVVAYPQHGMRNGAIKPLLAEALEAGATMVGGIAIETHEEITTQEILRLADGVGDEVVGVTLDLANVVLRGEDPVAATRRVAPLVLQTHMRDVALFWSERGIERQVRACGDGVIDGTAVLRLLRTHTPDATLTIENAGGLDGNYIPLFDPRWLTAHPELSTAEVLELVRLANQFGARMDRCQVPRPEDYFAASDTPETQDRFIAESARASPPL